MKSIIKIISTMVITTIFLVNIPIASATPVIGKPAPGFTAVDSFGKEVSLSDFRGKTVVLEWTNHECPYVRKHYGSDNMQRLQKEAVSDDIVWISIISSASGKQGYVDADKANQLSTERGAAPTHIVLDPSGAIGHDYSARTTPHMFIIDEQGQLVYMGGIDDKPTADKADIAGAKNFVRAALTNIKSGQQIATPTSRPYGCSVKYSS